MDKPDLRKEADACLFKKYPKKIFCPYPIRKDGKGFRGIEESQRKIESALHRQRTEGFKEGKNDKTPIEWANHLVKAIENARKEGCEEGCKEEAERWKTGNRSIRTLIAEVRNKALSEAEDVARNSSEPSDRRHEHVTCARVAEAIARLRMKR